VISRKVSKVHILKYVYYLSSDVGVAVIVVPILGRRREGRRRRWRGRRRRWRRRGRWRRRRRNGWRGREQT